MRAPQPVVVERAEFSPFYSTISAPTGKQLKPPVAESIGHQLFVAESSSPVLSLSAINRTASRQPTCSTQWKSFFCFVFFAIQRK
jgi:hypothetical protein